MFIFWFVSILFYWTKFPHMGTLVIVLGAVWNVFFNKSFSYSNIMISLIYISIILISNAVSSIINGIDLKYESMTVFFHLIVLCMSFALLNLKISNKKFLRTYFILFSFSCLFFALIGRYIYTDLFYYTNSSGVMRYQFLFSEPSYLAIYCCLILLTIWFYGVGFDRKLSVVVEVSLIVTILLTASGSGMFILCFLVLTKFGISFRTIMLSSMLSLPLFFLMPSEILGFIFHRYEQIATGSLGASTTIRFIAPFHALGNMLDNNPLFGVGLMNYQDYILDNYSDFFIFMKTDSEGNLIYNTNIDNGWALLFFNTGILGGFLVTLLLMTRIKLGYINKVSFCSLSFMLLFVGAFVHPLFLGLLYGNWKNNDE